MNRKQLTGCCPSCCSSELLWMCPWQINFSLCPGFVCDIGSQRNSCSTTLVFSVQSVSEYGIWETWPRQLAWHSTVLDFPAGSDTPPLSSARAAALVPRLRTADLSVSNTATLEDSQSDGFGRAPFLLSPRQQQLVSWGVPWYWNGSILSNKPFLAIHAWEGLSCSLPVLWVNSDNEWVEHWRNLFFEHWDYWILVDYQHREN